MGIEESEINRALWSRINSEYTDASADAEWAKPEIGWGLFHVPERELSVLGDVAGLDVIELGCGTAYFSSWLARRGARPVGVDVTPAQLATARRCQQAFDLHFPLIEANAENVPLPARSFDLAISEYGACLWCEPRLWLAEAARLLRPNGRLVFLTSSVLVTMCLPADDGFATTELQRAQAEIGRMAWPTGGVEFHPSHGEWIAALHESGFSLERMAELYAPEAAQPNDYYRIVSPAWARRWPAEELWSARRIE